MKTDKKLGIWMDHASAHMLVFDGIGEHPNVLESAFTTESKANSLGKSEHIMHNKEQHQQAEYYKKLGEVIRDYDEVLLFGPTSAKSELLNILKEDHRFTNIKVEIKPADKMSYLEQRTFVYDYFSK